MILDLPRQSGRTATKPKHQNLCVVTTTGILLLILVVTAGVVAHLIIRIDMLETETVSMERHISGKYVFG